MSQSTSFRFAIITDTHIRSPQGDLSSPFPVNEKANARARYACHLAAAYNPDFTMHLGDMVHPLPHMSAYADAVAEAHEIFEPLKPSLHFVAGNHDIGDKPSPGMPAKPVSADSAQRFQDAFGAEWGSFEHQGVLFVTINSSLVNSATEREAEQKRWLEQTLLKSTSRRTFLFSHYPPFINHSGEADHYDNYAEPGRSWLLELAQRHSVEAIFSGHVHHFFYNRYADVNLHCFPPTSFIRQDYAEMFAVEPSLEFGRDDPNKYSICIVDVDASTYRFSVVPTQGSSMEANDTFNHQEHDQASTPLIPHLRHAWFESRRLPYNGPMEEFSRKLVRNDYPLLRLLQLGINTVRIPLTDLLDPDGAKRIADWSALGIRFVFFSVGIPSAEHMKRLKGVGAALGLEVMTAVDDLADVAQNLAPLLEATELPVSVSRITTSADVLDPAAVYAHSVSSGFTSGRVEQVLDALMAMKLPRPVGLVFQVAWGQDPVASITSLAETLSVSNCPLVINMRLADANPACQNFDADAIKQTLKRALDTAARYPWVSIQCDTFEDVDRGYHPRYGLIDRAGNIRIDVR